MSAPLPAWACDEIAPAHIRWLWEPYLARGKLSVLDGDPGTGKSFVTVDLAARLSRGGPLPDGRPLDRPHTTLLLNAEDDPADTVRPRAGAAGADLSRVMIAGSPSGADPLPQLPDCVPALMRLITQHAADLLVIDPMMAFLPPRAWASSDQRVRQALAPLAGVAADTGCAVLLVRHLNKSAGPNAVYRGSGSMGILGAARTGLLLAPHPDDPDLRVLAMTKTNLGPPAPSLGFRLSAGEAGATVQWAGPIDLTADELCGGQARQAARRPRERAADFLRDALANGPRPASELEKLAAAAGISWGTVRRAKEVLGVEVQQKREDDRPAWYWSLPGTPAAPVERPSLSAAAAVLQHLRKTKRDGTDLFGRDELDAD